MVEFDEGVSVPEEDAGKWWFEFTQFLQHHPKPKSYSIRQVDINRETLKTAAISDILEPVFAADADWGTIEEHDQNLAHLSLAQRRLYAVWWYEAQVNNGGHQIFYSNSYGMLWQEALDGLEAIGADLTRQILLDSVGRFAEPPSRDRAQRNKQIEGIDFNDLDSRFFGNDENLDELMRLFIVAHPEDFLFSGEIKKEKPSEFKCVYGKKGFRWERLTP